MPVISIALTVILFHPVFANPDILAVPGRDGNKPTGRGLAVNLFDVEDYGRKPGNSKLLECLFGCDGMTVQHPLKDNLALCTVDGRFFGRVDILVLPVSFGQKLDTVTSVNDCIPLTAGELSGQFPDF
jgi:hypothetical protein